MRLTKDAVRTQSLPAGKSEAIFFDDDLPGFGLRLRERGSRTFVFQYKLGSKQRRMALGAATGLNLADVRKTAEKLYAQVKLGKDPASDKAESQVRAMHTFKVAGLAYREQKQTEVRGATYRDYERHLLQHAKPLHELQIAKISKADVAAVLTSVTKHSGTTTANRVRSSLSGFFSWAMEQGTIETNPVVGTKRHKEDSRERVLMPAELRLIWKSLAGDDYGAIVKLLALTGQRAGEIAGLRWSEINDDAIVLSGERTKNHRPHIVPLSGAAAAIIAERPKRGERDLIFGRRANPFSGWSNCKERLDARIAAANGRNPIPDWRLHDLRRTFATYAGGGLPEHQLKKLPAQDRDAASGLGIEPRVIEAVLNHVSGHKAGVAGIYNRSTYAREKKAALALWADRLIAIVEGRTSNVTPLRREA